MISMALNYFKEQGWDYVVFECGIGGSHCSSNFIQASYSVITSVGLDHWDILGDIIEG